jgi:hypothetical protein
LNILIKIIKENFGISKIVICYICNWHLKIVFLSLNRVLRSLRTSPALENSLSHGTDEARAHNFSCATTDKLGK